MWICQLYFVVAWLCSKFRWDDRGKGAIGETREKPVSANERAIQKSVVGRVSAFFRRELDSHDHTSEVHSDDTETMVRFRISEVS